MGLGRSSWYRPTVDKLRRDKPVIDGINLALEKEMKGFWKVNDWLRFQGYPWNHKRIYRVYCEMKLNLPRKSKRRIPDREAQPLEIVNEPNRMWALDFMHDALYNGRKFRLLNVLDEGVRECLAMEVDTSLPASRVVRVLEQLKYTRGLPGQIRMDNGPELISTVLTEWCRDHGIKLVYIQPGKPNQNAFVERFNRTVRDNFLNRWLFESTGQVGEMACEWMNWYNEVRPHDACNGLPPTVYRQRLETKTSTFELCH